MLHLMKLAVGARDVEGLRAWQEARAQDEPPLRHRTRSRPRRAPEILAGGSLYWVVTGLLLVRQRVTDIIDESWEDGSGCVGLVLDPRLVAVEARRVQPFQGWRYLAADAAPPDITDRPVETGELPSALRRELQTLCLL